MIEVSTLTYNEITKFMEPKMNIHVVQQGETIASIAEIYGVTVSRLIQENELQFPNNLVPGQTIVITYPDQTYIVQEGDSLVGIVETFDVTLMQLLQNNPFLAERNYIYPGETLVIKYPQGNSLTTIGYTLPFINQTILRKTLPYLTYLFIYNYRLADNGEVVSFYNDTDIIETSKAYGTVPIMLVTTLTAQGTQNIQAAYEILLNEKIQDQLFDNILQILDSKGYSGVNLTFLYLTETNENLYNNFTRRITSRLNNNGYLAFITVDPGLKVSGNEIDFAKLNYSEIGSKVEGISFINYVWGSNIKPTSPIISITNLRIYLDYVSSMVLPDIIIAGLQVIAYDWELPYVAGFSKANSLTVEGAIDLARDVNTVILFDELSQTPYFEYMKAEMGYLKQHTVWFIDARTVNSLANLISENNYGGPGIWNIMDYYPPLWLIINSQYKIEKIPLKETVNNKT
jgi:spore germination protein